jgi:hypothetical protein
MPELKFCRSLERVEDTRLPGALAIGRPRAQDFIQEWRRQHI